MNTYQLTDAWRKQLAEWRSSDHVLTFIGRPDKLVTSGFTVTITQADRDAANQYWDSVDAKREGHVTEEQGQQESWMNKA